MRISNCCGADVYEGTDFCTGCKEHCAVMVECPDCDGGEREVTDYYSKNRVREFTVTLPTIMVKCSECDGAGEVEE